MAESIEITGALRIPGHEVSFEFGRSGGPGGQNVNKVSTRVELLFDINSSQALSDRQKAILRTSLGHRTGSDGILRIRSDESRSQWMNRQEAVRKFARLLERALRPAKHRVQSSPTRTSRARRLTSKKKAGALKRLRGRVTGDE